jgi:RNA polymerase sigma-70 factor (ECF subfamily)
VSEVRDEAGFDSFFDASWRRLQGQAYVLTGSREVAQDLTQEALIRTWRNWDSVSTMENPEAWTRKVLQNLCIESWRKSRRRNPNADVQAYAEIPDSHAEIAQAMRSLPGIQAKALLLHDGLGMTVPEVAAELDVPEGTVKSWLSRSRKVVAERLGQFDRDPTRR